MKLLSLILFCLFVGCSGNLSKFECQQVNVQAAGEGWITVKNLCTYGRHAPPAAFQHHTVGLIDYSKVLLAEKDLKDKNKYTDIKVCVMNKSKAAAEYVKNWKEAQKTASKATRQFLFFDSNRAFVDAVRDCAEEIDACVRANMPVKFECKETK